MWSLVDYQILVACFEGSVHHAMNKFKDFFQGTHHRHNKYVKICDMYVKLRDEEETEKPYNPSIYRIDTDGVYETILPDGDTWESLLFQIRGALYERHALTHEFFKDIIDFMIWCDDEKYDDCMMDIMSGPLRVIKHMMGVLEY